MTDPGFKVEGVHQAVPFRSRTVLAGYHLFGGKDIAVLVEPATARALRAAASEAASRIRPQETGGLLSGRTLRDGNGPYVLVSGYVEAGPGAGRAAAFDVSPQATARLREESARTDPTADVVGWWHSHLWPSAFSQTDLASQSVWKQPQSVGLLVFATGKPWATAYMGPDAKDLGHPTVTFPPDGSACPEDVVRPDMDATPGPPSVLSIPSPPRQHARQPGPGPAPRQQGLIRLAVIILMLILALIVLAAFHSLSAQLTAGQRALSSQIRSGQRRLDGQLHRELATRSATPSIDTSCVSRRSGTYVCTAQASGPHRTVEWQLDGMPDGTGPMVTIRVPADGHPHQILALLETPAATYRGLPQTISPRARAALPTLPAGGRGGR